MGYLSALLVAFAARSVLAHPGSPHPDAQGKYTIEAQGIKAQFIPYAATLTNLFVKGKNSWTPRRFGVELTTTADKNGVERDIVLGYENTSYYGMLAASNSAKVI